MLKRAIGAAILAVLLLGLLVYSQQRHQPLKVSGFIEAYEIRVGSRVGGRVKAVHVQEGDVVSVGTSLLELEPYDLREQVAQARGILAQRQAELDKLKRGYRPEEVLQADERRKQLAANLKKLQNGPRTQEIQSAEARRDQADAELLLATEAQRRAESLRQKSAITQEEMDQVVSQLKVARSTREARAADLDLLQAGTRPEELEEAAARLKEAELAWQLQKAGYRDEDVAEAQAAVDSAQAALAALERQVAELVIHSAVDGPVEAIELRPGDLVGANTPAISLLDARELWVRAYVPENKLGIRVDQVVKVSVDSYPGRTFKARIRFVARQAEFTPGNVQTPEERSKQVFRIKVYLEEGLKDLRPGMTADVWLDSEAGSP